MLIDSNHKLGNQSLDFFLGRLEQEKFRLLGGKLKTAIFHSESLLLHESQEEIVGSHSRKKYAGTSLSREKGGCVFNMGFQDMSLEEVGEMLSIIQPLEEDLKSLCRNLKLTLIYLAREEGSTKKNPNSFLKEVSLTPPRALANDNKHRLFEIKAKGDRVVYVFSSLNKSASSLEECVEIIRDERINSEEIFLPSVDQWLGSIKNIPRVSGTGRKNQSGRARQKTYVH